LSTEQVCRRQTVVLEALAESTSYELAPLGIGSVIVQPGAYGTTFLGNSMMPKGDISAGYGPVAEMFKAFGGNFQARAAAGELGDPSEVVAILVEEVERPAGERPLRRPVGEDIAEPVGTINQTCEQVQNAVLSNFGIK
ncbi:MAG: hypothetical protein AAGC55_10990, partial [Myxococcota bacterium]